MGLKSKEPRGASLPHIEVVSLIGVVGPVRAGLQQLREQLIQPLSKARSAEEKVLLRKGKITELEEMGVITHRGQRDEFAPYSDQASFPYVKGVGYIAKLCEIMVFLGHILIKRRIGYEGGIKGHIPATSSMHA